MTASPRYLLLQTRRASDPMRMQEVDCFAWALNCEPEQITPHDLLSAAPIAPMLATHDLVLLGGSGDYSVAADEKAVGDWLPRALDALRHLHSVAKPTFASCWGFQAFCRALGGRCVHDLANAELGSVEMQLTAAGAADPLFGALGQTFLGHSGHEDRVDRLPADAELLASSARVTEQAIRFRSKPIYATQFHPELNATSLLERVKAYPRYVESIAGVPLKEFRRGLRETPAANRLLKQFADMVLA